MVGSVFLQRYVVVSPLGKGSMGTVYLARDQKEPRVVVVKVMHKEVTRDPQFKQIFDQEIQSLTQLRHPCVVGLLDACYNDAHGPCLIMEFIPGVTLEVLLGRHRRLPPDQVGRMLLPLCQALNAGHSLGVIHRDLKPANMMVMNPDTPTETVKVMDFGLAQFNARPHISLEKLRGSRLNYTCGTPIYIAPEMARGDVVDHRADLYGVGVILFELLLGKPPFYSENVDVILRAHVKNPPPRFGQALPNHGLSPRIEAVVMYCLEKYPNERPQTARKLAELYFQAIGEAMPDDDPLWDVPNLDKAEAKRVEEPLPAGANHPNAVVLQFDAWMHEPIAVVKLRGFVQDIGGEILGSEPGKIRVRIGQVDPSANSKDTPSGLFRWMSGGGSDQRRFSSAQEPIELLMYLARKGSPTQNMLHMTVVMKPFDGRRLMSPQSWQTRCEKMAAELRAYLIAK
jgi:serine/threonine protein kinase